MPLFDIFKVAHIFTAPEADGEMVVTQHYQLIGEPLVPMSQKEVKSLTNYTRDIIVSDYLPILSDTITYVETRGIGITDPLQQAVSIHNGPGLLNEACIPYDKTINVRNKTGLRGRSYTGFQQWLAPTEQQQDNGILGPTPLGNIQAFVDNLQEVGFPVTERVFSQGVYSKKLDTYTPVTELLVRTRLGRNKRRFATSS